MGSVGKEEVNRKLLHILAVGLPVFIFYGPSWFDFSNAFTVAFILGLFLVSLGIDLLRLFNNSLQTWFLKRFGSMLRVQEKSQLTGATYILAGSFICSGISLLSDAFSASVFLTLTLFILGDAAAALTGKAYGRIRVGEKSIEGAFGCFFLCLLLSFFIFPNLPGFLEKWDGTFNWINIVMISLAITLLELFPLRFGRFTLNDNLYVPALSAMLVLVKF
jgi:dolichol kinase